MKISLANSLTIIVVLAFVALGAQLVSRTVDTTTRVSSSHQVNGGGKCYPRLAERENAHESQDEQKVEPERQYLPPAEFVDGGLLIREPQGAFACMRLEAGDLLQAVNGVEITGPSALLDACHQEVETFEMRVTREGSVKRIRIGRDELFDCIRAQKLGTGRSVGPKPQDACRI